MNSYEVYLYKSRLAMFRSNDGIVLDLLMTGKS